MIVMLSKENYDKLNENFLYRKEPVIDNSYHIGHIPGTYWCKNWTFKAKKLENGKVYMYDTYWGTFEHSIEVTDEIINNFIFVFDFNEVRRLYDDEIDEYEENDLIRTAVDSGGYSCGRLFWVHKNIKKSTRLLIAKKESEIESLKWKLEMAEKDLKQLLDGDE